MPFSILVAIFLFSAATLLPRPVALLKATVLERGRRRRLKRRARQWYGD